MYMKSSLGMLRREGCVPALCQKVSACPVSGLCRCTHCALWAGMDQQWGTLRTALVPEPSHMEVFLAHL